MQLLSHAKFNEYLLCMCLPAATVLLFFGVNDTTVRAYSFDPLTFENLVRVIRVKTVDGSLLFFSHRIFVPYPLSYVHV